jgi:peptidyl-dipeptidase Dcp
VENPLLAEWDTSYGVPPFNLIESKHYEPAFQQAMSLHNNEIEAIISNSDEPTFENTIAEYDRS